MRSTATTLPSHIPSSSNAPSATPDLLQQFALQLDTAQQAGYLSASYASDPGGAPLPLAGLDLAPFRSIGLLPLSPDGLELGRTGGDRLILPHLQDIPYPSPTTGELSIKPKERRDVAWDIKQYDKRCQKYF